MGIHRSLFLRASRAINRQFLRLSSIITDCLSPTTSFTPTYLGSNTRNNVALREKESAEDSQGECKSLFASITELCGTGSHFGWVTIGALPDEVLLEMFGFYVNEHGTGHVHELERDRKWRTLVHVCRRWRNIVFASPRRLNLQLLCTSARPVRKMLDIWPALPIAIWCIGNGSLLHGDGEDDIIAALEHNDRICQIMLWRVSSWQLGRFAAAMHKPLPALTSLHLHLGNNAQVPVIPDSFLGGSAPCLRHLHLSSFSFPALPKLLISATDLVYLNLWDIPHSGYISPEAMATCLSVLTKLEALVLEFHSPRPSSDLENQYSPLLPRSILPALTSLQFRGVSKYLEDLVSRIDVPLLHYITLTFLNQLHFDTPHLVRFLSRTEKLSAFNRANLTFFPLSSDIIFFPQSGPADYLRVVLKISYYREADRLLSSLAQVCGSFLSPMSTTLESLDINDDCLSDWPDDIENTRWLELLHPFIAVKNLHLDAKVVPRIAHALQGLVWERVTEVLPALQNIFLEPPGPHPKPSSSRPVPEAIEQFAAARQLSGHPVVVHLEGEAGG